MPNYNNGKIYKLINSVNDDIYIGSTCNPLWSRLGQHLTCSRDISKNSALNQAIRALGEQNFQIILIENYPCKSKDELTARVEALIKESDPKLNRLAPVVQEMPNPDAPHDFDKSIETYRWRYQFNQQQAEAAAEYRRQYRLDNAAHIKAASVEYRLKNKDKIAEQKKAYRLAHLDQEKARKKKYYEEVVKKQKK